VFQNGVPVDVKLLWKSWDDGSEFAVYHPPSGQTHLLDALSAWVVQLLQVDSLSEKAIADRIVQEFGLELEAAQVDRYLENLLPRLRQLGLVAESV